MKLAVSLPNVVNMVEGYGINAESPFSATLARVRRVASAVFGARPSLDPMPPHVGRAVPWIGAGRALTHDPTAFFTRCRKRLGDTFVVDALGYRLFCLFSSQGVHNLWRLPEEQASKALAYLALLSHKVPIELFEGRRTLPRDLFARADVEAYLENLRTAVAFELDALILRFEELDASESFVHPHRAMFAAATRKRSERRAMRGIETIFISSLATRPLVRAMTCSRAFAAPGMGCRASTVRSGSHATSSSFTWAHKRTVSLRWPGPWSTRYESPG